MVTAFEVLGLRAARGTVYNPTSFTILKNIWMSSWKRCKAESICGQNKGNILELQREQLWLRSQLPFIVDHSEPGAVWTLSDTN